MDAVRSVPQGTELRQALDGAWYPFDGDKDTPSYKSYYGDSAESIWEANFLEHKQAFIVPLNLGTVTHQQHSEPTVSMASNEVPPLVWRSNQSDDLNAISDADSVPSSVEPTITPPEPRSTVRPQSSEIAAATGCVIGLEPSAEETTIVPPFHVLPRQQDMRVVWEEGGWVCLPPWDVPSHLLRAQREICYSIQNQ